MTKTLYVSPEAPAEEAQAAAVPQPAESRKAGKAGLRLGLLDNSKGNADHLLGFLAEGVRAGLSVDTVVSYRKPSSSRAAEPSLLDQLARDADCVVSAMAD
jgi:hypothetical protein